MDTIREEWNSQKRIGNCIPTYDKNELIEIEKYIQEKSSQYCLICKYNVGEQIGGVPPKGDITPIVNPKIHAIKYHDMLGGILISTRNSELNCRNVDNIVSTGKINQEFISEVISRLSDKYALQDSQEKFTKVIFLPGSNIRHIVDNEKIDEILFDWPEARVKPHPIQTDQGLYDLKKKFGSRLIGPDIAGFQILKSSSVVWSTSNSEIGLMAALLKVPFADITVWKFYYELLFSPLYRQFKYKRVEHNFDVIAKFLSSEKSGFIATWMPDWKERIDSYFNYIINIRKPGDKYPY